MTSNSQRAREPAPDATAQAIEVLDLLHEASVHRKRAFVVIRCADRRVVDRARSTLVEQSAPFSWRTVPVATFDPPRLLSWVVQTGSDLTQAFVAYGLPRDEDGRVLQEMLDIAETEARPYEEATSLLVLIITVDEMRALVRGAPAAWAARTALIAWPGAASEVSDYVPALMGEDTLMGGAAGEVGVLGTPETTLWAGSPYGQGGEEAVPDYVRRVPAPAGRRWGSTVVPNDAEGAEALDAGRQLLFQRKLEAAQHKLARTARGFRHTGELVGAAECYVLLGTAAEMRLDYTAANDWYRAAMDVYQQAGDYAGFCDSCFMIGYLVFLKGSLPIAKQWFEQARSTAETSNDELRSAIGYRRLGMVWEREGNGTKSAEFYERAMALETSNDDKLARARSLHHLARLNRLMGDLDGASEKLTESIALREAFGQGDSLSASYHEMGNIELNRKKPSDALAAYTKALELEEAEQDLNGLAATWAQIGLTRKLLLDLPGALEGLTVAQQLFRKLSSPNEGVMAEAIVQIEAMIDTKTREAVQADARLRAQEYTER